MTGPSPWKLTAAFHNAIVKKFAAQGHFSVNMKINENTSPNPGLPLLYMWCVGQYRLWIRIQTVFRRLFLMRNHWKQKFLHQHSFLYHILSLICSITLSFSKKLDAEWTNSCPPNRKISSVKVLDHHTCLIMFTHQSKHQF